MFVFSDVDADNECIFRNLINFFIRIINDKLEVMAPYGLTDLFEGRVKPTSPYKKGTKLHPIYLNRIQNKQWHTIWSNLKIEFE